MILKLPALYAKNGWIGTGAITQTIGRQGQTIQWIHLRFEAIMQNLPSLHEPPGGGILIGLVDGQAVGCVMYHEAEPGVAEFNRLYVNEKGRGRRLGLRMLEAMFARLSVNGFYKVFFTSATFLTHARAMYETAGFMDIPHPPEFPAEWLDKTYFMERHIK